MSFNIKTEWNQESGSGTWTSKLNDGETYAELNERHRQAWQAAAEGVGTPFLDGDTVKSTWPSQQHGTDQCKSDAVGTFEDVAVAHAQAIADRWVEVPIP